MAREERSAGFIIFRVASRAADGHSDGNEYLLLDYGRHWDFPKGHVKSKEDDLAAAIRELREETGITDARIVPGFRREISYDFRGRKKGLVRKTVVFFLGEVRARDVVLSDEHVGFKFLPYEKALARATYPTAGQLLTAAQEHLAAGTRSEE